MNQIRTLIADDQPMARERLAALLNEEPDVQVVAACASGTEAVSAIQRHQPDLVFLDMQMPELDGLGVIAAVGPERMPSVVFVTAYDEFALRAFDVHALDYLLKPFGRQRFQKALDRARGHLSRERAGDLAKRLVALVDDVRPAPRAERIMVRSGARVVFVETRQIDWVEAEGNYVRLHVGSESHLIRDTMNAVEARLGGVSFVRIHRSRIVNIDRVSEMRLVYNGEYEVVLRSGRALGVSRMYRDKLQERLKKP